MGEVVRLTNCTTGGPVFVDVQDGKIVRMTPIELDADDKGDWTIEARGRTFTPPRKTTLSPHAAGAALHDLLAQAHPHAAQARGLRPQRRAQHPEPRRLRLRAHQLGRGPRHRRRRDRSASSARYGPAADPHHPQLAPPVGQRRLPAQRLLPLHEPHRLHLRRAQPRQLGRLALGRHAHVGLQPPPGHPRAVRPARGRAQAHRDGRLLVGRPRDHRRRHLRRLREHAAPLLAEGARRQDGVHRPLLQPHRRALRPTSGSRRAWAPTWPSAWPSPTPGSPRAPTTRSTSPTAPSASTSGRTTCSARPTACPRRRSGPRPSAASRPARSARWPASGAPRRPCSPPAASAAGAAPAAPPPATSGRAPWSPWPPCRAGQAGQQHLGHHAGRARRQRLPVPRLRRGRHLRRPATTPRPASACSTACSRTAGRHPHRPHHTPPKARPSRACASPRR